MGNRVDIRDEPAKSIFLDAQEIASLEARAAYLDRRCGAAMENGHAALRKLLAAARNRVR